MKEKTLKTKTMNQNQIKSESVILSNQEREETHKCPICGKKFKGFGNNPYPVRDNGSCCDECNRKYVIPTRLLVDVFSNSNDKRTQMESKLIEVGMKEHSVKWIQGYLRPYFPEMFGDNNTVKC